MANLQPPTEPRLQEHVRWNASRGQPPASNGSWWWTATAYAAALFLGLGLLFLIHLFIRPIALLILGVSLAAALAPLVDGLNRRLPRSFSILIVYLILLLVFAGLGMIILPELVAQVQDFVRRAPDLFKKAQDLVNGSPFLNNPSINSALWTQIGRLGSLLISVPINLASSAVDILLAVVISAYWLAVAPFLRHFWLSLFPVDYRGPISQIVEEVGIGMGGYIRGTFIDAVVFGVAAYLGLLLMGVHYPLVLGVTAGLMELIPYVGPFISGAAMVGIALSQSVSLALAVLVFAVVLQELEGHVLVPLVMRTQTDISPLLAVLALFAGATVGRLIGALTAIPLAVALRVIVRRVIAPAIRRQTGAPAEPLPPK